MTTSNESVSILIDTGARFLSGDLEPTEFIRQVDAFVSNDMLETLPESLKKDVSGFQDEISLFTRDGNLIKDYPEQYFGIDELREKTITLMSQLELA